MNEDILKRLNAALDTLEHMEHRVNTIIEGNRMQLSHLAEHLKVRELRHELRNIAHILSYEKEHISDGHTPDPSPT